MNNKKFIEDILSCFEEAGTVIVPDGDALDDPDNQFMIMGGIFEYVKEYQKGKNGDYRNEN